MKLVYEYVPVSILDGTASVGTAGTRFRITTADTFCISATITAGSGNTGIICIGGSTVVATSASRRGVSLNAGDTAIIEIDNINKLYFDGTVTADRFSYYYKN